MYVSEHSTHTHAHAVNKTSFSEACPGMCERCVFALIYSPSITEGGNIKAAMEVGATLIYLFFKIFNSIARI